MSMGILCSISHATRYMTIYPRDVTGMYPLTINFLASVLSAAASFLRTGTLLRYTAAETAFKESPIFDGFKTKLKFCTST